MEDRHTVIPDFRPKGAADPALPRQVRSPRGAPAGPCCPPHRHCHPLPSPFPSPQFVAVYDGHSSHHGSEHASRRVHQFVAAQPAIQQCSVRRRLPGRAARQPCQRRRMRQD